MTRACHVTKQKSRADEDDVSTPAASRNPKTNKERSERVIIVQQHFAGVSIEPAATDVISAVETNCDLANSAEPTCQDVCRGANQSEATSTAYFTCYYCVSVFGRRQQLLEHIAGHFCDDPFVEKQLLPDVIGSGEGRAKYQCLFCDEKQG